MSIPLSYTLRNLAARKLTTLLTAGGMALVVFVFATVLMLEEGLGKPLVETGSPDNVIVTRRSAGTEVQSLVDRDQAAIVENQPEVAYGIDGARLASKETIVLIALAKRDSDKASNVLIRGVGQKGIELRPQVEITEGRMFRPGSTEIIAGKNIAERYKGAGVGETLRFAQREWTVVGIMDAGKSGFDSEIWGDVDQLMQAFRRPVYSSVILKLNDATTFPQLKSRLENDPRLTLEAKRESVFYAGAIASAGKFHSLPGDDAVDHFFRWRDYRRNDHHVRLGRQSRHGNRHLARAGFSPQKYSCRISCGSIDARRGGRHHRFDNGVFHAVLDHFHHELAILLGTCIQLYPESGNYLKSFAFALIMGVVGGFLPAVRAARLNIVDSLRAV